MQGQNLLHQALVAALAGLGQDSLLGVLDRGHEGGHLPEQAHGEVAQEGVQAVPGGDDGQARVVDAGGAQVVQLARLYVPAAISCSKYFHHQYGLLLSILTAIVRGLLGKDFKSSSRDF